MSILQLKCVYISQVSGTHWNVESSANMRATQIAELLATALAVQVKYDPSCNCINYPGDLIIPVAQLLHILPTGALPWKQDIVDMVIGNGTFVTIHQQVQEALREHVKTECVVVVTHTQQISATAEQYALPVTRLSNYGFVMLSENTDCRAMLFDKGLYR